MRMIHARPGTLARALLVAFVAGAGTLACRGPQPLEADPELAAASSAPTWMRDPVTWQKLSEIEEWLDGPGPEHWPELVPEAELQLAEGRLHFAREERAKLPVGSLAIRIAAAENGLRRVLASNEASGLQEQRARQGLALATELKSGGATSVAGIKVLPRSAWNASAPIPSRLTSARGRYDRITVHHSTFLTRELGSMSLEETGDAVHRIQLGHMGRERSYGDIGYHYLIDPKGRAFEGRNLRYQGAHSSGANNVGNIGICLLGNFEEERPTSAALEALEQLVDQLCKQHKVARSRVYGHQELRATECPGRYLMTWVERYRHTLASR